MQCLPGASSACVTDSGGCTGTMICDEQCQWGECAVVGECFICGDGVLDEDGGEECDDGNGFDGDGCSWNCMLEGPRPFRSCDCSLVGTSSGAHHSGLAAIAFAAAAICLRRRRRFR
ncbi:MAG: hypothetical protein HYY06_21565 [Deltaproteobacteria bacterium]|nr:hypothetical protein [Deltaproteobacteria bacterium]